MDNSVRILDQSSQESLAEYIARPPISLKKIRYEPFKGKVLFHTKYSEYFKQNVHLFDALDFLAELTQHIPPKGLQLIRRYGLYASRTKGRWYEMPWVAERAPEGWKIAHQNSSGSDDMGYDSLSDGDEEVNVDTRKRAWVRRFAKRYRKPEALCEAQNEGPGFLQRFTRSIRSSPQQPDFAPSVGLCPQMTPVGAVSTPRPTILVVISSNLLLPGRFAGAPRDRFYYHSVLRQRSL